MTLKECIAEIVQNNFSSGDYFDSHTVLNLIFQNQDYHLAYLQEFHEHYSNCTVAQFHGFIAANIIARLDTVRSISDSAVSINIYGGKPTKNWLWQKI